MKEILSVVEMVSLLRREPQGRAPKRPRGAHEVEKLRDVFIDNSVAKTLP